jgi:gamma-glutamyltranspeptidase/glutathione hydrolase
VPRKESPGRLKSRDLKTRIRVERQRVAASRGGMVATAHSLATWAGVQALESGGNAFDAAAAAAFALGVCEPAASGLGGQTMALCHDAESGRTFALDGSSRAPNRTALAPISKKERLRGYRAATVPSTPAALDYMRRRYGRLKLATILKPSIRIASEGFVLSSLNVALVKKALKGLRENTGGRFFLKKSGALPSRGDVLRQPVLARTFERIAKYGVKDFYRGEIATAIDADMRRHGGLIRLDDLAQIPRPIEREALRGKWWGEKIVSFPPPAAGRAFLEMAHLVQKLPPRYHDLDSEKGAAALASLIRQAYEDRKDRPFDPNYFPQVRRERMLSQDYAERTAKKIRDAVEMRGETTHLSVMDNEGNAVALTQSIERVFGSCCATPSLGFLYNNYMSAFETEDPAHPYSLRPNAVPWASVAPTLLFKGRRPVTAIGSPGSERIASAILQVLLRLHQGESPFSAVTARRLHCALDGTVSIERDEGDARLIRALRKRRFGIDDRERFSFYLGCVQFVTRERGYFVGVADPRRDGAAGGPNG